MAALNTRGPMARAIRPACPKTMCCPSCTDSGRTTRPLCWRGELAREPFLANLEAVLFAADEPLPARRLAKLTGLDDTAEARRLVRKLQALYERRHGFPD